VNLSTEHQQVADMARRFANEVIRPEAERLDREESFPAHIYKAMGETGLFGITALNDTRLSLQFTNLFDADPPYVNTIPTPNGGGGYDPAAASPLGRVIAVSLEKKF